MEYEKEHTPVLSCVCSASKDFITKAFTPTQLLMVFVCGGSSLKLTNFWHMIPHTKDRYTATNPLKWSQLEAKW